MAGNTVFSQNWDIMIWGPMTKAACLGNREGIGWEEMMDK